jgi:hypothetical protein
MYIILDNETRHFYTEEEEQSVEAFLENEANDNGRNISDFTVYEVYQSEAIKVEVKLS